MLSRLFAISSVIFLAATSQASHANEEYKLSASKRQNICNAQKAIRNLRADIQSENPAVVMISWDRMTVPEAVQFQVPPSKRHPKETWIALNGNAQTNGQKLNDSWFKRLETEDKPNWSFRGMAPGMHSVTVAHKSECGTWNMKGVSFTIEDDFEEVSYAITDQEAEDLSFGANLSRYADCMVGGFTRVRGSWSIVRRNGQAFVKNWVKSPLRVVTHPVCLIQATGGLHTPPDPDRGIMNCHIELGITTGCPSEWLTFYQSPDGTEALSRMGPGPAPTAVGRDDQARLSCMAVILQKYNENGRNLDRAFEDPWLISQGCNKARPQ